MAAMPKSPLQEAVNKLVQQEPKWATFLPKPTVGARPGGVTVGTPGSTSGNGGQVFDEADFTQREYWPQRTLLSSDGFFSFSYRPIRSILLEDGTRATFEEPTP